jgi:hypothetical protein
VVSKARRAFKRKRGSGMARVPEILWCQKISHHPAPICNVAVQGRHVGSQTTKKINLIKPGVTP